MFNLLNNAGYFSIPLSIFLFIAIFVSIDRLLALRETKLGIFELKNFLINNNHQTLTHAPVNLFEKILFFYKKNHPETEELRAYAEFELNKLERGLFMLDIVISAAPLIGLLGTVSGLMHVFSCFISGSEIINNEGLANGIALSLTTTALGLLIAIPAILVNNTILRKLDKIQAIINLLIERLICSDPS